ncbi:TPA_asm: N [Trifolium betacytorhabdovirus 1]|nr:TPA_asm: N [Trifolium betacytorhabdovirus 1]
MDTLYGDVNESASFSALVPKAFTRTEYDRYQPYKSLAADKGYVESCIKLFKRELEKDSPDDNCPYLILFLAQQLKTVVRPNSDNLFKTIEGDEMPEDVKTYLTGKGADKLIESKTDGKPSLNDPIDGENQEDDNVTKKISVANAGSGVPHGSLTSEDKVFYPYLAAYLLKMISKQAANAKSGMDNFFIRFSSFYSRKPPSKKIMSDNWFATVKTLFTSDPKIAITWVKQVVEFEESHEQDTPDVGLVRYLAVLPLSYTGMHAYKLFGDIKMLSKLSNTVIIHGLTHSLTIPGLQDIVRILRDFEKQMPDSQVQRKYDPAFKYARILSSQFFVNLQTKSCPALVYVLAELLGKYRINTNPLQNPSNIIGMNTIPDATKAALKDAVDRFYKANQSMQGDLVSPYFASAFASKTSPLIRIGASEASNKPQMH